MKYLIIGGKSVFAEPLIDILTNKIDTEVVIVTKENCNRGLDKEKLYWRDIDIHSTESIENVLKTDRPDLIYDFEVQDSVGYAWNNPNETVNVNIVGTINLLNVIKNLDYKPRLIIGGSGEEYGHLGFDHLPLSEDETPHPVNVFGATKACQTMFAKLYHKAYGIDVIVLRTFNETSTKQDDKWAISSFCHQFVKIERGEQLPVIHVGNTDIVRDFTNVKDLARAFDLVAENGVSGEVYNAARGEGISIKDIIHLLKDITGIDVTIRSHKSKVRPIDVPSIIADVKKIEKDTGWKANITIRETLVELIEMWREAENG